MSVQLPAFGESNYLETRSNRNTRIVNILNAGEHTVSSYCQLLKDCGYENREFRRNGCNIYAAFSRENTGVFLNYYGTLGELNIALEENCGYFAFEDRAGEALVPPQITQMHLVDFGMSYAIRLSDGRFIVIDGGWDFEPDVKELYRVLKEGTPVGKPVVAAWFLTHPHRDHHLCFAEFIRRFEDEVIVEKLLLNYPEADDLAHYPELENEDWRVGNTASIYRIPQMLESVNKLGIPVYEPHTGQIYRIGDATCEILSCMDDTILINRNLNPTSLVIRMELGGQVILWTGDTSFSIARLPERHGTYLKADIMQVPHHGFQSGAAEGEIAGYDLAKPKVCLIPVSEWNAYSVIGLNREGTKHMMNNIGLSDLIAGDTTRTITLPYTPPAWAKDELKRKCLSGFDNNGACTWIFSDLDSNCKDDFAFSFFNGNNLQAEIMIDIYFDVPKRNLSYIKATVPGRSYRKLCIIDESDVLTNAVYFNWEKLEEKGIPENASFAVRFVSDRPVVISHKRHQAAFTSANR